MTIPHRPWSGPRVCLPIAALLALSIPSGCAEEPAPTPAAAAPAALPDSLFLAAAPPAPRDVKAVKDAAGAGDEVVVRGRIGGGREPFVPGRAVFTLVDAGLPSCADNPEDACKYPWDYCCEPREVITANAATIRLPGEDGQPIRADLNGVRGLAPMAEVIVVGKVAESDGGNLVIDATGVYVPRG